MRHNHGISSCSSRRTNASNSSREVLPFTPHAGKPGTIIRAPPSVSFAASSTIKSVAFRRVYDCGDLPAAVLHDSQGRKISWKTNPDTLDPTIYVPLFLDGLCETSKPYDVLSRSGSYDLIGRFCDRIPGFIQLVVSPIRRAFNSRNPQIICVTLTALEQIAQSSRESASCCNRKRALSDHVLEALEALEKSGGPSAYAAIKYMVPTYESCISR
ncbi:parkin coregulated gene protein-like isoform X2 [Artemia franciscana]|uniref:parkin coregulated gene protein-like isoform X2 n=1 Tax=Artemia franciscana TaxID=6661 RepID=UPI0032DB927D